LPHNLAPQILGLSTFNLERTLELLEAEIAAENAIAEQQAAKLAAQAVIAAASNCCSNGHNCHEEHDHAAHDHTAHAHSSAGASSSSCGDAHCTAEHRHSEHDHNHKRKHDGDDSTTDAATAHTHSSSKRLATEQHQQQQQAGTVVSTRHDSAVGSLGLTLPGAFDHIKFNDFMKILLDEKSADIYRCKVSNAHCNTTCSNTIASALNVHANISWWHRRRVDISCVLERIVCCNSMYRTAVRSLFQCDT
jgi:hypothetical protein